MSNIIPKREKCVYTSCYCEENIWKLCEHVKHTHPEEIDCFYVVFISNKNKTIPIWMQRAADNPNDAVVWDYHVILVQKYTSSSFVYDLDTLLSFPCPFDEYVEKALGQENRFQKKYIRYFRVIPAKIFLETFASDRSHMFSDGEWKMPPPDYPCIKTEECTNNLDDFISMDPRIKHGEVFVLKDLVHHFSSFHS